MSLSSSPRWTVFKKAIAIVTLMALTSFASLVVFERLSDKDEPGENVIRTQLNSSILGELRDLNIHLPANMDSTATYPVLYVLDGGSQAEHIARTFDVLSSAGYAPPVIVVGIPNRSGDTRDRDLTPPFIRRDVDKRDSPLGAGDVFLSFMESELIPFIERTYPASSERMLSGHSRGALLVMYSLSAKPSLFQARFCHSGPYWREDTILARITAEFLRTRDTFHTFLFMSLGKEEGEKGFARMIRGIEENEPRGFILQTSITQGADHQKNASDAIPAAIARWSEYRRR